MASNGGGKSGDARPPGLDAALGQSLQEVHDAVDRGFAEQAQSIAKLLQELHEQRAAQEAFMQESRLLRPKPEKRALGSQVYPSTGTSPTNRKSLRLSVGGLSPTSPSSFPTSPPGFGALSSGAGGSDRPRGGRKETSISTAADLGSVVGCSAGEGAAAAPGSVGGKASKTGAPAAQNTRGSFGFYSHYSSEDKGGGGGGGGEGGGGDGQDSANNNNDNNNNSKKKMSYSPSVIAASEARKGPGSAAEFGSEATSSRRMVLSAASREKSFASSSRASAPSAGAHARYSDMLLARPHGLGKEQGYLHYCAARIMHSKRFDYLMGIIILINCICIGLEIQLTLDSDNKVKIIENLEHVFLVIYILELVGRWLANGNACWSQGWFMFDFFLVMMGALTNWILIPFITGGSVTAGSRLMEQILIVRILRLLRLVRALRMLEQFKGLWRLVQGLLNSVRTMLSTVLLMVFTLYVFACVGIELIMKDDQLAEHPDISPILNTYFSSIPRLMLTLVQFATTDSIAAVYSPLVYENPYLALYFMPLVLLISITMMNLVTAILVEDAISSARMDADMEQAYTRKRLKYLIPEIKAVFHSMDVSGDGSLSLDELELKISELQENKQILPREVRSILDPDKVADLEAIFDFLDGDGSRTISEDEFVEGICQLAFTHVPIETTQMLQMLKQQRLRFDQLLEVVQECLDLIPMDPASQTAARTSLHRLSLSLEDHSHSGGSQPPWSAPSSPTAGATTLELRRLSRRRTSSGEEVGPDDMTGQNLDFVHKAKI